MRLIDADALFKEEREEYRNNACYISTDYEHIFAEINNSPTVCDIEQIRAEIESLKIHETDDVSITNNFAINKVLQIINKYTKGVN